MSKSQTDDRWWRGWIVTDQSVPGDAVAVLAFLLVANAVRFSALAGSAWVRALVGFPLLFFAPGYAVVSGLFPTRGTGTADRLRWGNGDDVGPGYRSLDWRERVGLSFGTSVALLPLLAVALSVLGLPFATTTVVASLSGITVAGMAVATVRRRRVPAHRRFRVPATRWTAAARRGLSDRRSPVDAAVNVGLAIAVVAALATVGGALVTPNNAETFTSVSLLTTDDDGDLVANGYPDAIGPDGEAMVLEVENDERQAVSYEVVAELQRVRSGTGDVRPVERAEVHRAAATVEAGGAWTERHTVEPALGGEDLRLVYYVYRGDAPAEPTTETAYRHVHVWVDVPADAAV